MPDIILSSPITPSTTGSRQGGLPRKPLAIAALAIALVGLGFLLLMTDEPRTSPPGPRRHPRFGEA